jgi:hypothetical protein
MITLVPTATNSVCPSGLAFATARRPIDLLADDRRHDVRQLTGVDVGAAAGGVTDDEGDRTGRPVGLGAGHGRQQQGRAAEGQGVTPVNGTHVFLLCCASISFAQSEYWRDLAANFVLQQAGTVAGGPSPGHGRMGGQST